MFGKLIRDNIWMLLHGFSFLEGFNNTYKSGVVVNQEVRVAVSLANSGAAPVPLAGLRIAITFNRTLNLPVYDYGNTRVLPATGSPLEFIVSCYPGSRFRGGGARSGNATDACRRTQQRAGFGRDTQDGA